VFQSAGVPDNEQERRPDVPEGIRKPLRRCFGPHSGFQQEKLMSVESYLEDAGGAAEPANPARRLENDIHFFGQRCNNEKHLLPRTSRNHARRLCA
jgi:hypothetical protein